MMGLAADEYLRRFVQHVAVRPHLGGEVSQNA
jgi:hypothetical protein